eukprot:TRINITY_DN1245_c0_g1_i1.p1 TRINITY_DN1245_c0_g1~~TRINITY_DN1245_c0_g1_i1.p1  ORF type:complete len:625 (+),score=135.40 TRINITY_DN1245_c0_g1_i1:50-1924(+)
MSQQTAPAQQPSESTEPPRRFIVRGRQGLELFRSFPGTVSCVDEFEKSPATCIQLTSDGKTLIYASEGSFAAYSLEGLNVLWKVEHANIKSLSLSPLNTFVVSWEPQTEANKEGNLIVWRVSDGSIVTKFPHKSNGEWLKWTFDEAVCGHLVTSEIHFYDGRTLPQRYAHKLTMPGVADFSFCPQNLPVPCVAIFIRAARKDVPCSIKLFNYPLLAPTDAFYTKSFFKADSATICWSPSGKGLLLETHTEVDTSGKSYYGETNLYFVTRDGKSDCNVELQKEGPIHDVAWSPSGKEFIVVHGFTPAKAIMYDAQARPTFDFGVAPRNFIKWSPHGRFVCLAGFGNLAGEIDIWDKQKQKKVGECVSNCAVSFEWSPCSRYFTTATLFPRLRVDNCVKIWKHNGALLHQMPFQEIYEVKWQPAPASLYRDRAASPAPKPSTPKASGQATATPSAPTTTTATPGAKAGAYVPPHLRKNPEQATQSTVAAALKREEQVAKKIQPPPKAAEPAKSYPVGYTPPPPSKAEAKRKKQLEKKQQEKEEQELLAKIQAMAKASEETTKVDAESAPAVEPAKRAKAIQKKLRQIEQLREKQKKGTALTKEEEDKLSSEAELVRELASLNVKDE